MIFDISFICKYLFWKPLSKIQYEVHFAFEIQRIPLEPAVHSFWITFEHCTHFVVSILLHNANYLKLWAIPSLLRTHYDIVYA